MIKFKVSEDLIGPEDKELQDIIYTIVDETKPEIEVRWIDSETNTEENINYSNADMQEYFRNGDWIKVE